MKKLRLLAAAGVLAGVAFGAGQATGYTMTTDEATLRARLLSCAVMREAAYRHIAVSRLPVTSTQCLLLR
jgi:hypothetical protein